jgi:Uri superfamily endonuclease
MKGTYALVLHLPQHERLTVGKLGDFWFPTGYYLYFGSALNSLEGRLRRHLTREKKQHWHIDYLTAVAQIVQTWWTFDDNKIECSWAQRSLVKGNASVLIPGFGSSDCRACPAHLVHAPSREGVEQVRWQLEMDYPNGGLHVGSSNLLRLPENLVS